MGKLFSFTNIQKEENDIYKFDLCFNKENPTLQEFLNYLEESRSDCKGVINAISKRIEFGECNIPYNNKEMKMEILADYLGAVILEGTMRKDETYENYYLKFDLA